MCVWLFQTFDTGYMFGEQRAKKESHLTVTVLASISVNMNSPPSKSPFRYNSALKHNNKKRQSGDQYRQNQVNEFYVR